MRAFQRISENFKAVQEQISSAARRSGRTADAVRLVAVTKYVAVEAAELLVAAGANLLGESRPQELWNKAAALAHLPIEWHMIGHLQRNKAARTAPLVSLVHSGDSVRILSTLNDAGQSLGRRIKVLLEVNISGDATKHGFSPNELPNALDEIATFNAVSVQGLMAMASREGNLDRARRDFSALRELRDHLRRNAPEGVVLDELSMGMSGDFEIAIEEGATIVRVGSALFEGIDED